MTPDAREEAIQRAGELMERRYALWSTAGNRAALDEAHRALQLMKELIAGRSPEQVRAMESERGLV